VNSPIRTSAWLDSCATALLTLALLSVAHVCRAEPSAESFVPYTAKYNLRMQMGVVAEATFDLKKEGKHWRFNSRAKPKGMVSLLMSDEITETSLIDIEPKRIRPLSYTYRRGDPDEDTDEQMWQIKYNWQQNTADISTRKGKKQIPLQADILDPMTVQLALAQAVKQGCTHARYTVFDEDKTEEYVFEQSGMETVQTPLGDYAAVKIHRKHGKRETVTWFAPKLNYIPVRIRQLRNGNLNSELNLVSAEFAPR
jgi:hypothetical protein